MHSPTPRHPKRQHPLLLPHTHTYTHIVTKCNELFPGVWANAQWSTAHTIAVKSGICRVLSINGTRAHTHTCVQGQMSYRTGYNQSCHLINNPKPLIRHYDDGVDTGQRGRRDNERSPGSQVGQRDFRGVYHASQVVNIYYDAYIHKLHIRT